MWNIALEKNFLKDQEENKKSTHQEIKDKRKREKNENCSIAETIPVPPPKSLKSLFPRGINFFYEKNSTPRSPVYF
jgi:hypothetical protein